MIDVLRYRWHNGIASLLLVLAFAGVYVYKQQTQGSAFSYSIDFTGGTQVTLRFDKPVSPSTLTEILENEGWAKPIIHVFSDKEVLVRVQEFANDSKGLADRMRVAVVKAIPGSTVEILQSEAVGAGIGAELRWNSVLAVLYAFLALLIYIALSFWSPAFAIGAVIALMHDAIIMLAFRLFFDKDISVNVIAAILTVLGYSINDTIIIFSRIRTNIAKMKGVPLYDIVNLSINQTLRRTILTSFATSLVVASMLIFSGEVFRDFAQTMLIGIVFGAYSSIYIASPIMMMFYKEPEKQ